MKLHLSRQLAPLLLGVLSLIPCGVHAADDALDAKKILTDMQRVADWQTANLPKRIPVEWTQAAYYTGHMALAEISPDSDKYLDFFRKVGEKTKWELSPRKSTKYHADDHAIGQSYIELAQRLHNPSYIRPTQAFFDFLLENPPANPEDLNFSKKGHLDKWSWCDALFMAPPSLARLFEVTGDKRYLDYMNNRWWHTTDYLFDKKENLYFRDSTYFKKKEANGKKVFWGRGNGWVIGGIVRVLQSMPADYPDRPRYEKLFRDMSAKLLTLQGQDGLWRASLLDPDSYPSPETSSTGFITYGFAWGVNTGLLDRATYWPATVKGWNGLLAHVDENGRLGSCQPIGKDPKKITDKDTDCYGSGALLLAGAEIYKAILLAQNQHGTVTVKNPVAEFRNWETVEIPAAKLQELTGTADPAQVIVFDALAPRLRDTQAFDSDGDGTADTLLFQTTITGNDTRGFILVRKPAGFQGPQPIKLVHSRFAPDRMDDYLWENDRIAHRAYGPALITGEGTLCSGIDIFLKSTPALVMDKFYKSKNYHQDHGEGLDCYDVGQSRGLGGSVVFANGKWYPSQNFATHKTLASGPIRAVFELSYSPWDVNGRKVSEVKRFTVDAGKDFTQIVSTYTADGTEPLKVGTGVVRTDWEGRKRHAKKAYVLADTSDKEPSVQPAAAGKNWLADWQLNKGKNGTTGVGAFVPIATEVRPVEGHWLVVSDVRPGQPLVAYIGAGWDKGWYPAKENWFKAVETFSKTTPAPLQVSYGK